MRTTRELEELGWLTPPTAKINYLVSPLLQELFPTYDDYAMYNYEHCHGKWNTGSRGVYALESRGTHALDAQAPDIAVNNVIGETIGELIEADISGIDDPIPPDDLDLGKELTEESIAWARQEDYNAKVKKLKYYGKKEAKSAFGLSDTICPCCSSRLVVNEVGVTECSGDRLKEWELSFLQYNKLSDEDKRKYIILQANSEQFVDLYEKWNIIDEKTGFRATFECGYSNKLANPISRFRTSLPDPVLVKRIERSLQRELTIEEKHGESAIWFREGAYSDKYKKGAKRVRVPQIIFPDGAM